MSYLIHFNKNHSSKDGRFVSGDGDGDGQLNDNANRSKDSGKHMPLKKARRIRTAGIVTTAAGIAGTAIAEKFAAKYALKSTSDIFLDGNIGSSNSKKFIASQAGIVLGTAATIAGGANILRGAVSAGKAKRRGL